MKHNKTLSKIKKTIERAAKNNDVEPYQVTGVQYKNEADALSHWELRMQGGFASIRKFLFHEEIDILTKAAIRNTRTHKNKLDKQYGDELFYQIQILEGLKEMLKKAPLKMHKPHKRKAKSKKKITRTLVAHLSDTHFGANIKSAEVGGLNSFNWEIASRRTAFFIDQIVSYKPQYRSDTDCILLLNGDIIAGMIHDQEWFVDELVTQVHGSATILVQAISYLAREFGSLRVYCSTGNHGRAMHKTSKSRAATHKWDSYETMLYQMIKMTIEAKFNNVKIDVPMAPYSTFECQGHKMFMTHGDTVLNVGNPGKSINMSNIANQVNKINTGLRKLDKKEIMVSLVGHVHTPTIQLMDNGIFQVINGCLSGLDPFANSIGIFESHPTQILFESTKKHPVGDQRFIQAKAADDMYELDKIINPFKNPLDEK